MESKNLFFATFSPSLRVVVNEQTYVMHRTNKYEQLSDLFIALAKFANEIKNVKVTVVREDETHRIHAYL